MLARGLKSGKAPITVVDTKSARTKGPRTRGPRSGSKVVVFEIPGVSARVTIETSGKTARQAEGWAQVVLRLCEADVEPESLLADLELSTADAAQLLTGSDRDELAAAGARFASAKAVASGRQERAAWQVRILQDALDVATTADHLGVDSSRIRQRLRERSLLGVRSGTGGAWLLPRFQFDDDGREIPHVAEVLRALPDDLHLRSVAGFLTTPKPELVVEDESTDPREWLLSGGDPNSVIALAQTLSRG